MTRILMRAGVPANEQPQALKAINGKAKTAHAAKILEAAAVEANELLDRLESALS